MVVYCIDTSALIAAWQERYPIENFPSFWSRVDGLIIDGRLIAPMEVLRETGRRSDELHTWLSGRKQMFRELEAAIQVEAAKVLAQFPRLVGERKLRTSADPFVIALARVENVPIVTMRSRPAACNGRISLTSALPWECCLAWACCSSSRRKNG
jgi:Domain of unknown function (DUF4411)